MEVVKVEIEMPKEAYELAVGLGKFGKAVKMALADGWQMGNDIPVVMTSALADLLPALQGADKIADEANLDPVGVGAAVLEGLKPVFKKG